MIQPISIYTFKQIKTDSMNCTNLYELISHQGDKFKELYYIPTKGKNTGKKIISVYKDEKKEGAIALSNSHLYKLKPHTSKNVKKISRLDGSDINPTHTRLYGDLPFSKKAILVEIKYCKTDNRRILNIMVFNCNQEQAISIYQNWDKLVKESTPDNNIVFSTKSVQTTGALHD